MRLASEHNMMNPSPSTPSENIASRTLLSANVTIRQLRAFVGVAQLRSFTTAARQIHVTQSALSALVRELETEVGVRLFDRTTRAVELTAAGRDFLPVAQRILQDLQGGLETVRDLSLKRRGSVTIAATPVLAAGFVAEVCAQFNQRYPLIRLAIRDELASISLESLRSGEADLAVGTFSSVDSDIRLQLLGSDPLGAVLARDHPLATKKKLLWSDLAHLPLIALNRQSAYRLVVEQAMLRAGLPHEPAYEVGHLVTAIGLAQSGLGVAVCPAYARRSVEPKLGRFVPLHQPVVVREVSMAQLATRTPSPAALAFMALATEMGARMSD
jgi:DNA-binding transcriptional LysR family regulator